MKKKKEPSKKTNKNPILIDGISVHCSHSELKALDLIIPNPRNPNTHPDDQVDKLARLYQIHGIRHPITLSSRSGFIVYGEGRLKAAQKLNLTSFPVEYQDFESEAMEWAAMASDNLIQDLAFPDGLKMAEGINELDTLNFDEPLEEMLGITEERLLDFVHGPDRSESSVPDLDITGDIPEDQDYIIISFSDNEQATAVREMLGGEASFDGRVIRWADLKEKILQNE